MKVVSAQNLICPLDGEPLESVEIQLVCKNGHSFDVARQGYVNLLPVQHKRSKSPGDSKEMVVARTRFLDSGVYQPLAEKLSDICLNLIKNISNIEDETICLMDAGCGEGYYFNKIFGCLVNYEADNELSFVGLDISKPAIHEAAKRNKLITWLVGTNRQPPLAHDSVDVITCVFGFQSFEGFSKILKAGGKVVLVEPGPDHLCELREIIYTDVKKTSPPDMTAVLKSGFSLIESHNLKFKTSEINNVTINNLLLMTPHFYRANKEGREQAENIDKLSLTVDIVYRVLTKD